jgi:hypothetical protein
MIARFCPSGEAIAVAASLLIPIDGQSDQIIPCAIMNQPATFH